MPSSACSLQYAAVLFPPILKNGRFVQESYEQTLPRMLTMPSASCCFARRRLAAVGVEARFPRARAMWSAPPVNVHHTVVSVVLAVCRRLPALDIDVRSLGAGIM